jgi:histidinol phosphatase-like enzyme
MLQFKFNNFQFDGDSNKIAGFDLDYTLIKTKSGRTFAKDKDDWVFLVDNTVETLKEYNNQRIS